MRETLPALRALETRSPAHWALKGLFWIALVWFVKAAQPFLAPIVVAVVLTLLLGPGVRLLNRRGLPVAGGASVMVALLLIVLALIAGTLATPASQWWERAPSVVNDLLRRVDRARSSLAPDTAPVARGPAVPASAGTPAPRGQPTDLRDRIAGEGLVLGGSLFGRTLSVIAQAAATLLLLFFLLISESLIVSRIVEAFPNRRQRAVVLSALRSAQRDISRFFGSLGLIYSGVGLLTAIGLAVIGLPNAVMWGVLTALLNFIPYIGPVLVTAILFAAGLMQFGGDFMALMPPTLFLLIHLIEANFISPWLVAQRLLLSPVAVFLSVLFWAWAWGITGALIAVPMLVSLRSVCKRCPQLRLLHLLMQGSHAKPPSLRALLKRPGSRSGQAR